MNTSSLFLQLVARRAAQMATVSAVALQVVGCTGSVTTGAHDGTGGSGDSSVTSSKTVGPGGGTIDTTTVTTGPEDETVTSTSTGWSTSSGSFLQALCMPWPIANTDATTNDATVGTTGYYPTTGSYQYGDGGSYGYAVVAAGTTVGTGTGGVGGAAETTAVTVGGSGGYAGEIGTNVTVTTVTTAVGVGGAGGWLPGTSSTSITTDTTGIGGGFGSGNEAVGITVGGGNWTCPDAAYALQYLSSACGVLAVQDPGTYDAGRCCYVATVASCTTF